MIPDKRQRLKEAAIHSIRMGKAEDALTTARYLSGQDPQDAELFQIQGVALAALDRPKEAIVAMEKARKLAPEEPKHAFNLAAQYANSGRLEDAKREVREALRLAPDYGDAKALLDRLEDNRPMTEDETHLLFWLKGREVAWTRVAYGLMLLAAVLSVLMIVNFPAAPVSGGEKKDVNLKTDPLSQLTVVLFIASSLSTFVWMLTDIVDRRRKFTWMVPLMVCGVLGFNFVPLALYFYVGRGNGEKG